MDKIISGDYTVYSKEVFEQKSGIVLSDLKFERIRRLAIASILKFRKLDKKNLKVDTVQNFLMRTKGGSKRVRKVLCGKSSETVSSNILKYSELTQTIINSRWSALLNNSWSFSYLQNNLRTFIFKLHNNILGLNSRVAHFVRGHPNTCTFCDLSREPYENQENTLHLFFDCTHVEILLTNFYSWIFGEENYAISRTNFFLGFNFDCAKKNKTLFLINMLVKFYVWNCKLRFTLPNYNLLKEYFIQEIKRIARQSTVMRNIFISCGIFDNINEINF